jgi:hypothetical protein
MDNEKPASQEQITAIQETAHERAEYLRWLALRLEGLVHLQTEAIKQLRQLAGEK